MKNLGEEVEAVARTGPRKKPYDLSDRVLEFAANTIRLTYTFPSSPAGKHISLQMIRSSTSIGANYEEGCAAQSRADFIHKLQISFKETKETLYWIRLAQKLELVGLAKLEPIMQEGKELELILAKSLVTSKGIQS